MRRVDLRRLLGQRGEDRAVKHLRRLGYTIVTRNWRHTLGEIDVIARDGSELVFVEVRTKAGPHAGSPEASVTGRKQRTLVRLASAYIQHSGHEGDWRIDVLAIDQGDLRHTKDAVSLW